MFRSVHQKRISAAVFAVYLVLLIWLILLKFSTDLTALPHMRSLNLIPFGEPMRVNNEVQVDEMLYNVLVFMPLGVYVSIFCEKWNLLCRALPAFGCSVLFEALQYGFSIGASDITDVICNTLGGLLGVGLFSLFRRIFGAKSVSVVNGIGIAVEAAALGLLGLLFLAN